MLGLFIGIVLIIIGLFIIPIGFAQIKDELGDYSDKPLFKRILYIQLEFLVS